MAKAADVNQRKIEGVPFFSDIILEKKIKKEE